MRTAAAGVALFLFCAVLVAGCAATNVAPLPAPQVSASTVIIRADGAIPKQTRRVGPRVPPDLAGRTAEVEADVHVSAAGDVIGIQRISGHDSFYEALAVAVRGWKFEPLVVDGRTTDFILPLSVSLSWDQGTRPAARIRIETRPTQ